MGTRRLPWPPLAAEGLLLLVTLLAAMGWLFSKAVLAVMPPLLFMALRFAVSGLLLWLLARARQQGLPSAAQGACLRCGALLGVAMMCWVHGLSLSQNVGVAAFISSLGMVLAPFAARLLFGAALPASAWQAMGLATAGMACLSWQGPGGLQTAEVYLLLAALGQACYLVLNSRDMQQWPVLPAIARQLLVAAAACALLSAWQESWQGVSWAVAALPLLGSIVLATSLRFVLQGMGQGRVPVARSAFILLLEPVWTALLAAWWFGSGFAPAQWLGAGLVLLALLLSRRS